MAAQKTLTFYLDNEMRLRAEAGSINIINRISNAFESRGYQCLFQENSTTNLLGSVRDPGYSMFHMEDPFHPNALNLRRAYYYPFWRIESSAKRWEWQVARDRFDPAQIDLDEAHQFANYWRKRNFETTLSEVKSQGYVYIPLQGMLQVHRSFQTMSPLNMVAKTLKAEPSRPVRMTLHPNETYSTEDQNALKALIRKHPRLRLIQSRNPKQLQGCAYVVSQNSSQALDGLFLNKPAILFAQIDFHHIARNVGELGVDAAFAGVTSSKPEYDKYIYWFLQQRSVNAGKPDAEEQILQTVRARGWNV